MLSVGNPHYYTRDCCVCSVHRSSFSETYAAIKGGQGASPEAPTNWSHGSQLVFLFRKLSPSWKLCSVFQQKMLEEYLWVAREVSTGKPCNPTSLIGSILGIIPLHIPMREVLWWRVPSSCVIYYWGFQYGSTQELTSLVRRLDLVTTYSGRRRSSFARCTKRTCEALTVICLLALETFLPEYEYHYSLSGNNKFVHCNGLGPM